MSFDDYRFRSQVDSALTKVKTVLDNTRSPTYAADVPHKYDDKYGLAEYLTNSAVAADLTVLELLGLSKDGLDQLAKWAQKRSVTLRLKAETRCTYDREEKRKVESSTQYVTEVKSSIFGKAKITDKTYTTIIEQFWKYDFEYELFAFRGNKATSEEDRVVLRSRKGQIELKTTNGKDSSPYPKVHVQPSMDVNLTWMLNQLEDGKLNFSIDRTANTCRTPRRNMQVGAALAWFGSFRSWCYSVDSYFRNTLFPVATTYSEEKALSLSSINDDEIFIPVLPLFEEGVLERANNSRPLRSPRAEKSKDKASSSDSTTAALGGALVLASGAISAISTLTAVLPASDLVKFLAEQKRSILEKFSSFDRVFPTGSNKLITSAEANILALVDHAKQVSQYFSDGIEYIEHTLRKQLIAAIGKEVGPIDFANYMRFHQRKLYRTEYEPRPFSHAIRRPDHFPEGTLSIEAKQFNGTMAEPISTITRHIPAAQATPMRFPISAAADVVFGGDRYLHAWIQHQFEGNSGSSASLIARAHQFSSFILVVGRIASVDVFEPKAAIIIQNKDDLEIPLMLETIPTPKEFRDAIESMSPEQQRFCKAYRAMQLESTLFGLCVIQIKPQLEKLLNLPYDSLTKEIRLTQDLMELFMKYQVPSDLISFGGSPHADARQRVDAVKTHVAAMYKMISDAKQAAIEEAQRKAAYERAQNDLLLQASLSSSSLADYEDDYLVEKKFKKKNVRKEYSEERVMMKSKAMDMDFGSAIVASAPMEMASFEPMAVPISSPDLALPEPAASSEPSNSADPNKPADKPSAAGIQDEEIKGEDFTKIPTELDSKFEELDVDSALRPTIINVGDVWTKKAQAGLLASQTTQLLHTSDQSTERDRAYDLLDALSRSGALSIDAAELHVVIAATHCFDKSLIDTVIQDNVNPIEKVERSSLIVATTIHGQPAMALIKGDQSDRVRTYSPMLFATPSVPAIQEPK